MFRFQIQELPDVVITESLVDAVHFDERDDAPSHLENWTECALGILRP